MSRSFPPPPKRRPWWKFKTVRGLLTDRRHYREAMGTYAESRAAHGLPPFRKNWFTRHKILTSVVGLLVFLSLLGQCGGGQEIAAGDPAATTTTVAVPSSSTPATTPAAASPSPTLDAAAKKRADAAAKVAAKKKAQAEAKKKAAAKKKAEAAARKKAAAKKKASAERAAAKRAAAKQAEENRFADKNTFANCTDMNQTYPHGVGLPGARDQSSGPRVTTFKVNRDVYDLNSSSDRDDDGIACEKL